MKEATPFQAWQNWRRGEAVLGSPMTTAYELAAVSRVARPQAMTRVQAQKPPKEAEALAFDEKWAVGQNMIAPMEYRERPIRIQIL